MHSYNLRSTCSQHEGINNHPLIQPSETQQPTSIHSLELPSRNESSILQLYKLPREIIQRIASHTSCMDVFTLQLVCHALHHACSDTSILRALLDRSSIQSSDSAHPSGPAWYSAVLSPRTPFSIWARYAQAHEDMEQLIKDLGAEHIDKGYLRQRKITSWLPQLLALHCQWALKAD